MLASKSLASHRLRLIHAKKRSTTPTADGRRSQFDPGACGRSRWQCGSRAATRSAARALSAKAHSMKGKFGRRHARERVWPRSGRIAAAMAAASDQEVAPFTLHDLRRSAATGMAALAIAPHVVDKILNHSSGKIAGVARIYNRFSYLQERKAALEAWARHIESRRGMMRAWRG